MKHIILIIFIAAAAIGVIAWFQTRTVDEPRVAATADVKDLREQVNMIDIGSADQGFQLIDADIEQL